MNIVTWFTFLSLFFVTQFSFSQGSSESIESQELPDNWKDTFQKHFYIGFEGTSVSGFEERGTVRVGALIYNILGKDAENELEGINFLGSRETHFYGNWLLTTSAEQSSLNDVIKSTSAGSVEQGNNGSKIEPAFEASLGIFKPIYYVAKSKDGRDQAFYFGPIIDFTLRKPDNLNEFSRKNYGGARMAHGSEAFFDILAGKTEGIEGTRLELRGQTPISPLSTGKVYAGVIINIGVKNAPDDSDSLRLYVSWHYDLDNWLGINDK